MNLILDLRESRAEIRASLEARLKVLNGQLLALDGEGWGDRPAAQERRRSEADRRALALATGQTFVPAPEPDRADLQREIGDIRRAIQMHDAADALASEPELQRRIDVGIARVTAAVTPHLKALAAIARLTPELLDALDDLRIFHLEGAGISDTLRRVGEIRPSELRFRPDVEELGQQLVVIAERAELLLKDAAAAGLKV